MTIKYLPNNKLLKTKNGRYTFVNTQFPWINVAEKLCYLRVVL